MADDLLPTAAVAELLGKSVATVNRWVNEKRLVPAFEMPGTTGARLFRRSDVERLAPCQHPSCSNDKRTTFHNSDPCPYAEQEVVA